MREQDRIYAGDLQKLLQCPPARTVTAIGLLTTRRGPSLEAHLLCLGGSSWGGRGAGGGWYDRGNETHHLCMGRKLIASL